jgi:hypothetical protein
MASETRPKCFRRRSMEERESLEDFAPVRSDVSACCERSAGSKSRLGRDEVVADAAAGLGGGCCCCLGDDGGFGGTWDARRRTDRGENGRVRMAPRKTTENMTDNGENVCKLFEFCTRSFLPTAGPKTEQSARPSLLAAQHVH